MKTRTDFLGEDLRTALQWAKMGKIVNSDAKGIELWSNGYRQHSFIYYGADEVHIGSAEELQAFFKPIRDHQRKLRQTLIFQIAASDFIFRISASSPLAAMPSLRPGTP